MTDDAAPSAEDTALIVTVDDRVATLTLNRPEKRNALSSDLIGQLRRSLRRLDEDEAVDVVVLTGADPAFCAGLDLKELGASGSNLELLSPGPGMVGMPFAPLSKPLIGAVNGAAVTGGLELALHCDILIASERAVFGDTHARVGVMPAWGLTVLLPQAVGARVARQMSLTGDYLTAADALRLGLVTAVVAHGELLDHVRAVAATIAANDQLGVRTLLSTYRSIAQKHDAPAFDIEAETSSASLAAGFDPASVEHRRAAIVSRGRGQSGGSED